MACFVGSIFLLKIVKNISYTQTVAACLVGVSGANAFARCAHLVLALGCLVGCIEQAVSRHNEVCLFRNVEAVLQTVPAFLQVLCFVHEEVGSQHNAVADDVNLVTLENARWNGT